MAIGRAFMGLGDDLMRIFEMESAKRERARREAIDQKRYEDEQARLTRGETRQSDLDRLSREQMEFSRANQLRQTLGPGETQNVQAGELLSKWGLGSEIDQSMNNETEGTVNETNPRRFSLPPNFIEQAQQEDQRLQREQAQRQQEVFQQQQQERQKLEALIAGLPPEMRQRAESHRLLGGFDPTMPDWKSRNTLEQDQAMARIKAGQQDQLPAELRQTIAILNLTKPDANAEPEAFVLWRDHATKLLSKYLSGNTGNQEMFGPSEEGLETETSATEQGPGFFDTMKSGVGSGLGSIQDFLGSIKTAEPAPTAYQMDIPMPNLDIERIINEIRMKGMPNPRDPKYKPNQFSR